MNRVDKIKALDNATECKWYVDIAFDVGTAEARTMMYGSEMNRWKFSGSPEDLDELIDNSLQAAYEEVVEHKVKLYSDMPCHDFLPDDRNLMNSYDNASFHNLEHLWVGL
ncbi:hypothetical protein EVB32_021 [Rhizobium phage RHph_TM39]|nr:hypothetical protein EVB95_021 [Rhizobium phage RHph_TM2_3B]QIG77009.1 hypothetical protein EVB32_021 [Rhizobium phage RHph_TM39]